MKLVLYKKLVEYLVSNLELRFKFEFEYFGYNIKFNSSFDDSDIADFFNHNLADWCFEEGNKLINHSPIDSVHYRFYMVDNVLFCDCKFSVINDVYSAEEIECKSINEILTSENLNILQSCCSPNEELFEQEELKADLEFHKSLLNLNFYYKDKYINIKEDDFNKLRTNVENILSKWDSGLNWTGVEPQEVLIRLEIGNDEFEIRETVFLNFIITCDIDNNETI